MTIKTPVRFDGYRLWDTEKPIASIVNIFCEANCPPAKQEYALYEIARIINAHADLIAAAKLANVLILQHAHYFSNVAYEDASRVNAALTLAVHKAEGDVA